MMALKLYHTYWLVNGILNSNAKFLQLVQTHLKVCETLPTILDNSLINFTTIERSSVLEFQSTVCFALVL